MQKVSTYNRLRPFVIKLQYIDFITQNEVKFHRLNQKSAMLSFTSGFFSPIHAGSQSFSFQGNL